MPNFSLFVTFLRWFLIWQFDFYLFFFVYRKGYGFLSTHSAQQNGLHCSSCIVVLGTSGGASNIETDDRHAETMLFAPITNANLRVSVQLSPAAPLSHQPLVCFSMLFFMQSALLCTVSGEITHPPAITPLTTLINSMQDASINTSHRQLLLFLKNAYRRKLI